MADDTKIRPLLTSMLDGDLSDAEFAQMADLLRVDAAAREIYLEQTIVSARLERLYCSPAGSEVARSWRAAVSCWAGSGVAIFRRYPVVSCAAALVVVLGLVWLLSVLPSPSYHFARELPHDSSTVVAQLVATSQAQWDESQVGTHRGAHLLAGHVMKLQSGRAEVLFDRGARIVLRGPAELLLDTENSARLVRGELAAYVPSQARGFLVKIPGAEVIDRGTEFAVAVDESGDADVHVFQGLVECAPDGEHPPVVLRRGESRRVSFQRGRFVIGASKASKQAIAHLHKLVEPLPDLSTKLSPVADAYVQGGHPNEQMGNGGLLLVKHSPRAKQYEREAWLAFDVASIPKDSILGARLVLTVDFSPGNTPGAERETRSCRFGLYGVTDDSFAMNDLTWSSSQQVPRQMLGMFRIDGRGQRGAQVKIGGAQLVELLKSNRSGRLTLAIVRHDEMESTVHAFASSEHPDLAPPMLEVWHEAQESEAALPAAAPNSRLPNSSRTDRPPQSNRGDT